MAMLTPFNLIALVYVLFKSTKEGRLLVHNAQGLELKEHSPLTPCLRMLENASSYSLRIRDGYGQPTK